jgi:hypothetical protein
MKLWLVKFHKLYRQYKGKLQQYNQLIGVVLCPAVLSGTEHLS